VPRYRATFVRVGGKKAGARVHPSFSTNATDDETLEKEAASALRAIPFLQGEWELKGIEREQEKPKKEAGEPELWKMAAERVIRSIFDGTHKPGSQLPSPHTLAKEYGISSSSIYRAYRDLRDQGWVSIRRDRGTFVRARSAWPKLGGRRST
jgi:hypothetical protein